MEIYIAAAPAEGGTVGTGPVDLGLGTQFLNMKLQMPEFSNMQGNGGPELNRAQEWFREAASNASTRAELEDCLRNAVKALNNLGIWNLVNAQDDNAAQLAYSCLSFAEEILRAEALGDDDLFGGVLFNIGNLLAEGGHPVESEKYLREARGLRRQ